MKVFLKNLGIILVLLGVVVFFIYSRMSHPSNAILVVGLALEIAGVIGYIFLNKKID